ncbi:MAG: cyclic pyranopterin monophosphate synthase MoaC, partial [Polyangiaceae bacterium]|nr:cyclic pyranopterin monophosphate synthase MoaC [Polyangiaceae bacterium]
RERVALAESWVKMSQEAFQRLKSAESPKGDILATARLAGIMAAKKTADLIPLCHPLALTHLEVDFELEPNDHRLRVTCSASVFAATGVEMEAMVGVSIAALTIYDMLKSLDRGMSLGPTRLLKKTGGRSGEFAQ